MKLEDFLNSNKPVVEKIKYKINKIVDKQDFVVLHLDNKEKINLSVETYFEYGISSLKGLDDKLYDELKQKEIILLAFRGALRKLSTKDYTIKQINDYLIQNKKLYKKQANEIIEKLKSYGLLDDDKYCLNRFSYLNKQNYSIKQIEKKLINEGITKDLIDKYVINNSEDEFLKCSNLANKYLRLTKNKSTSAIKQSILTKLVGAGFSYDASKNAIDCLKIENKDELVLLKKEYDKAYKKYANKYEDYELKNHIYAYLLNKGFRSEDIKNVMEV